MRIKRLLLDRGFLVFSLLVTGGLLAVILQIAFYSAYRAIHAVASEGFDILVLPPGPPGGEIGGLGPVLINTVIMTGLSLAIASPIGVVVGVYLSEEKGSKLARVLSVVVQMLAEVPTIVIGLFVFTLLCLPLRSYSLLAGAVSLAIAILPFIVTQVRESLNSIPFIYREAAYSLCLPRWKTIWLILAPMSRSGIASSVLLGYMRAFGETAPVLLTAGFVIYGFYGITGPSSTLSLLIYKFSMTPYENLRALAWTAANLLFVISISLTYLARRLAGEVKF